MGVETVASSYQPISYGFISLFFFPIIFGFSIYSLSKYDEYLNNKLIVNTIEGGKLAIVPIPIKKRPVKDRRKKNALENFTLDAISLIKREFSQSKEAIKAKKLIEFGTISLLALGGTSLISIDIVKNRSSTVVPGQVKSLGNVRGINISSSISTQGFEVKKIRYISASLRDNHIQNNNTYKAYLVSNRTYEKKALIETFFMI